MGLLNARVMQRSLIFLFLCNATTETTFAEDDVTAGDTDRAISIEWRLPAELGSKIESHLPGNMNVKTEHQGERIAPIVIVMGTAALSYIVHMVIDTYHDMKYGGVILSIKDHKLQVTNDARLPSGIIVVFNKDNVQVLRANERQEPEILSKLAELSKKP